MDTLVAHQPYHTLLQEAFRSRREKNPAFSLRAFARAVGISVTTLSKVMRYERNLSRQNLQKLAAFLQLSPLEIESLTEKSLSLGKKRLNVEERLMAEDEFLLISDWQYFAILSLARTKLCRPDPHWIAKRLGITPLEANTAVTRLVRMGLVEKTRERLIRTVRPIRTTTDVPSHALKKLHAQQLELASQALTQVPVSQREITSITLAIDPSRIPLAKQRIGEFRDVLGDVLESGEKKDVYLLSIQLFPLKDWSSPQ